MIQRPVAVGLKLCEYAIREERTRRITLVNCLRTMRFSQFPSRRRDLVACAVLTEGSGIVPLTLELTSPEDLELIATGRWIASFPHPLYEAWCLFRFSCSFPVPGKYQWALVLEGETIAQTTLSVLEASNQ